MKMFHNVSTQHDHRGNLYRFMTIDETRSMVNYLISFSELDNQFKRISDEYYEFEKFLREQLTIAAVNNIEFREQRFAGLINSITELLDHDPECVSNTIASRDAYPEVLRHFGGPIGNAHGCYHDAFVQCHTNSEGDRRFVSVFKGITKDCGDDFLRYTLTRPAGKYSNLGHIMAQLVWEVVDARWGRKHHKVDVTTLRALHKSMLDAPIFFDENAAGFLSDEQIVEVKSLMGHLFDHSLVREGDLLKWMYTFTTDQKSQISLKHNHNELRCVYDKEEDFDCTVEAVLLSTNNGEYDIESSEVTYVRL